MRSAMHILGLAIVLIFNKTILADDRILTPSEEFNNSVLKENKAVAAAIAPALSNSENPHVKPFAAIIQATRWAKPEIFVCWENGSPSHSEAMAWTRDAVQRTWEKASALTFVGWEQCASENKGIRILIEDSGPLTQTIGSKLNEIKNGMILNFTFENWGQECRETREDCIRAIAVHEFGHAISFVHEQNRPDVPGECRDRKLTQGPNPDTLLTKYDPQSVMNYCNKKWNNDGFLSELDIEAVQTIYGKPKLTK